MVNYTSRNLDRIKSFIKVNKNKPLALAVFKTCIIILFKGLDTSDSVGDDEKSEVILLSALHASVFCARTRIIALF